MNSDRALVRKALRSDAEGIARVHIASSEDSYAPLARQWPAQDLGVRAEGWKVSLDAGLGDVRRVDFVATQQEQVVGFISGGPARGNQRPATLEIYVIHVLPSQRGRGIGSQLWEVACSLLRGPARDAFYLNTLGELACCDFYESRGGEVLARKAGTFHGGDVTEVIYFWPAGKPHA